MNFAQSNVVQTEIVRKCDKHTQHYKNSSNNNKKDALVAGHTSIYCFISVENFKRQNALRCRLLWREERNEFFLSLCEWLSFGVYSQLCCRVLYIRML